MTDPDAPSREDPKWSEFCHWISSGIELPSVESIALAKNFEASTAREKKEIIEYMGPAPPDSMLFIFYGWRLLIEVSETGKHRYVFLLYRHSSSEDLTDPKERRNWGTGKPRYGARQWAKDHGLILVGMFSSGSFPWSF